MRASFVSALGCLLLFVQAVSAEESATAPLANYLQQPDDSFTWKVRREGALVGGSYCELTLTSQTWRGTAWRHQLFIYKPPVVRDSSRAILMIGGGRWRDELLQPPPADGKLPNEALVLANLANGLQTTVAVVLQVPFQPIFGDLVEDQAIAYTFDQYLKSDDNEWPLLLPMVKSAVRAMDAIHQLAAERWKLDID
jgi:PhoPQ-activated pathogenicity-related protein